MSVRLVTVITFDLPYKADIAKSALEDAGIRAEVNDREVVTMDWLLVNAVGGVKVQVAEEDAERALVVLERLAKPGAMLPPVSDEELERQALEAPTEEEERVATALPAGGTPMNPDDRQLDRERQATAALWWMIGGVFCLPAWGVGMYYLLSAAFRSGSLSSNARISLQVAGAIAGVTTLLLVLAMTRMGR